MSDQRPDKHRFRILQEHRTSDAEHDWHQWVDLGGAVPGGKHRDAIGRLNNGYFRWGRLDCNNPDCGAVAIYRLDVIEDEADRWDERRGALASYRGPAL